MEKLNYILGLDIGISSVGWGLLALDDNNNPYKIIDVGSRIFAPGETEKTGDSRAKERREKRGTRRVIRRRAFRLDRVRNLLYENNYIKGNITSNIISEKNEELVKIYNDMLNNYYRNRDTNPYKLKVEALDRKLTDDELSIILVHYAKKRGYKSNREEDSDNENGKVKSAIKENIELIKNKKYRTISEMYIKDEKFQNKIKNTTGNYKLSVTNEMYLEEINKVLDSQIKFGLITNKFKEEYLNIYNSRRHYSMGPGGDSPYAGNLIEKMTGKCKYDGNFRAPKKAFSSEVFVALTKLINLRYKSNNSSYISLSNSEIHNLIEIAKIKNKLTYADIVKELNVENIKFKDLNLSKKNYKKVIDLLKEKLGIKKEEELNVYNLNEEEKIIYNNLYNEELFKTVLIELKGYHELRKVIETAFSKEFFKKIDGNYDILDELALLCTNCKLNEEIKKHILESKNIPHEFADDSFISLLPNFKDHLMLSTPIIRKLIPLMFEGKRYDQAMDILGYKDSEFNSNIEKKNLLVPICVDENIRNQRVMRSLTQTRKVINAIIKKYGMPKIINIETARELSKTKEERKKIEKNNLERKEKNNEIKKYLVELGYFSKEEKINSNDILKYNLWKEQNEFCAYSLEKISLDDIYINNNVQIDHILPYSRTFNDNYLNKTLVFSKANQDKGNNTPYEWFGKTEKWIRYESYINSLNISSTKKDNYLLKVLDFDMEREMRQQNLNDTKYIAKELSSIIKAYLNVEKVNMYQGSVTGKLRARWGFNRLTHSYISNNYIMPSDYKEDIKKDRDNHLHHAMDALVIASITPSLQREITLYEQFKSYIDNNTKDNILNCYRKVDNDNVILYDENGEVIKEITVDDYLKEEYSKNHIKFFKHNIAKLDFPLPYENFDLEAKVRVYERDINVLKDQLETLKTYSKDEINNVKVLIPSIAKAKISGAMHKDTYYGLKKDSNTNEIKYRTIRKPIENITKKDLESIPDRNGGSKAIIDSILSWLGNDENGANALKRHNGQYPINLFDKEKKEIKKLKIYEEYKKNGHIVNGANVEKGNIYKINIYKSKNKDDDKLYFVALDMYEIKTINEINKGKNIDLEVKLEYGQANKNIIINYNKLLNNYISIMSVTKNEMIKIKNKNDKFVLAYLVGMSNGQLEVKSPLGDGYDLIGDKKIFKNIIERYNITISTIKEIKKMSINLLGEISEL